MNVEHADLLGFKTGFKTFTERKPLSEKPAQSQAPAESTEAKGEEEKKEQKEGGDDKGGKGGYKGKKPYNSNWKGDRKEYKDDAKSGAKPNFDDASLFPKLG